MNLPRYPNGSLPGGSRFPAPEPVCMLPPRCCSKAHLEQGWTPNRLTNNPGCDSLGDSRQSLESATARDGWPRFVIYCNHQNLKHNGRLGRSRELYLESSACSTDMWKVHPSKPPQKQDRYIDMPTMSDRYGIPECHAVFMSPPTPEMYTTSFNVKNE